MSWMQHLYQTYDQILQKNLATNEFPLTPIGHTLQTAHIEIVLNENGVFQSARVMPPKSTIILPVTEESENRTSGEAPHPLADKIQYVAKDYCNYGGTKKAYFGSYLELLQKWCDSPFSHPKVQAVLKYVNQGTVMADLVKNGIFHLDDKGHVLHQSTKDTATPDIFSTLSKSQEYGSALICWSIEINGDVSHQTWLDKTIQQSWINYITNSNSNKGFCFIKGTKSTISTMHPAKLRHTGDKAKLISSNDKEGYTFRGRFNEAKEAAAISDEISAKSHSALRWLITRQGIRNNEQVTVVWAINPQLVIPSPLQDNYDYIIDEEDDFTIQTTSETNNLALQPIQTKEWYADLGKDAAKRIRKKLLGLKAELPQHEQISLLMLDSATPGRMAITYYQEFLPNDYFNNLDAWLDDFSWYQRYSYSVKEGKKEKKQTIWPGIPPSPDAIAKAVYGRALNDKLKKQVYARLLPVIVGGKGILIPFDFVQQSFQNACNPNGFEKWEWERNVGVACALYRGWCNRHQHSLLRRNYSMALETENHSRDYLYGRLLAIAENIESYALYLAGEKRATNAERYMQRFAESPYLTWRNIELALEPYKNRLRNSRLGFLIKRNTEIDEIMNKFIPTEFTDNTKLTGEFLLGYHCQKMFYRLAQEEPTDSETTKN